MLQHRFDLATREDYRQLGGLFGPYHARKIADGLVEDLFIQKPQGASRLGLR